MAITVHYYDLTGQAGQVEDFFRIPFEYGVTRLNIGNEIDDLVSRVMNIALGIFICLLTLPLYGISQAINFCYRIQIDPEHYQTQTDAWSERLEEGQNTYREKIIDLLIKSGKRVEDCPFTHIVYAVYIPGRSYQTLASDGHYAGFLGNAIRPDAEHSLIIGGPGTDAVASQVNDTFTSERNNRVCSYRASPGSGFNETVTLDVSGLDPNDFYPDDPASTNFKKALFTQLSDFDIRDETYKRLQKVTCIWTTTPLGTKISPQLISKMFPEERT
jgi:hypothetical protein